MQHYNMNLTLKVWKQKNSSDKGQFETYQVSDISSEMSFLEMFDVLNEKLITELSNQSDRSAHYVCALVFINSADDPNPLIVETSWHGEIVDQAKGSNGFGYDPHFFLPELGKTAAELDPAQKNLISHRGQALRELIRQLQART